MNPSGLLFSVNTVLAFQISKTYFQDIHYVWCSEKYAYDYEQPASSNPIMIAQRYIADVFSQDSHSALIQQNKSGLKRGAAEKRKHGIITFEEESKIISIVDGAPFERFLPLLYIIPMKRVYKTRNIVPVYERASPNSNEYRITNLNRKDFEIVDIGATIPAICKGGVIV